MLESIERLLADESVTDVLISPGTGVWIDDAAGLHPVADIAVTERAARALAEDLLARGGRHIDQLTPIADARLAGGVRVHAVLSPVATTGTSISLRIPRTRGWRLAELANAGMITAAQLALLQEAVRERKNVLISGPTGSGKTTLLAAMLGEVSHDQRIITIEDVAELAVHHPCVVALEVRKPNGEGIGAIDIGDLVRNALRMRPDRLVVGECRGPELLDFLTALNTGHTGGGITLHANTLTEVPARLAALAVAHGVSRRALSGLAAAAVDLVVHLERREGQRVVSQLGRLVARSGEGSGDGPGELTIEPL